MIRYLLLILNMMGLLAYKLFISDGVSVAQNMPAKFEPGKEYLVEVQIHKGTIGGFARLQQEFPKGVNLQAVNIGGATFSFSGTTLKMIWTSLPSEADFKISYKVTVDAALTAALDKVGTGKFSYVLDNVKQTVDITDGPMTGLSANGGSSNGNGTSGTTAGANGGAGNGGAGGLALGNGGTAAAAGNTGAAVDASALTCDRTITQNPAGDYTVNLVIHRGTIKGFCKLQENLPAGIAAASVQNAGASFNFAEQKVKLVWIQLPAEGDVKVSYKLTGKPKTNTIDGFISYLDNDATRKYTISPSTIPVSGSLAAAPTGNGTVGAGAGATAATGGTAATGATAGAGATATTGGTAGAGATATTGGTASNRSKESKTNNPTEKKSAPKAEDLSAFNNAPDKNNTAKVLFKVQICALRRSGVAASYFSNSYGLSNIGTELHEGWTKYTIGGTAEYKIARDLRESTRGKGVPNPFVTAYNLGKRITVQEALMIANQQWYK